MNRKHSLHPLTAVINKTQRHLSKQHRTQALCWLAEYFPEAFNNTSRIRPLKAGIMDDVLYHHEQAAKDGISRSKLRQAVVVFTRRLDYLTCLKAQEMRIDLSGNPVTPVTPEEALQAAQKIQKHLAKKLRMSQQNEAPQTKAPSWRLGANSNPKTAEAISITNAYVGSSSQQVQNHFHEPQSIRREQPTITIKRKMPRNDDPSTIARLKEKLGLT